MSEVDANTDVVTDIDQNRKYIEDFIDHLQKDNFAKAEQGFNSMVGDKLANALDQQKAKLAGAVFHGAGMDDAVLEPDDEEQELAAPEEYPDEDE